MKTKKFELFATCPKGLENLLRKEYEVFGVENCSETVAGIKFTGTYSAIYQACLWSRLTNRLLLSLFSSPVRQADDLYNSVRKYPWSDLFSENATIAIDFTGTNSEIRNTQFGAQCLKDAIVDYFRDTTGNRPSVDRFSPDIRISAHLHRDKIQVSLNLAGESLHRRGYRIGQGAAPLKENLAAAILYRADWPNIAQAGGALIDPMCGSGTLLIEGALMAADIAPGLLRDRFGFEAWRHHQADIWREVLEDAQERRELGLQKTLPEMRGYDQNPHVIDIARANAEQVGVDDQVRFTTKPVTAFKKPTHKDIKPGLAICNPPYGERLGEVDALREDYFNLAQVVKNELPGWTLGVFTGNPDLGKAMRLRARKKYRFFNGKIPCDLLLFDMKSADQATLREDRPSAKNVWGHHHDNEAEESPKIMALKDQELSDGAQMFANRLRKNHKRMGVWAKKEGVSCYRVYDADMPEYSAAIDIYEGKYYIQEYAAPKTIDKDKAAQRFQEIVLGVAHVFQCEDDVIYTKIRQKQRGHAQYKKQAGDASEYAETEKFSVSEYQAKLWINLSDYIDSGLFLDHRPLRRLIANDIAGKSFLNLFCYTASATVHAALGGATESISVDLSNTYLAWAKKNFEFNKINARRHQLIREDCFNWIKNCRRGFDVIMLDPPTFSNSKKMENVLDIQRDHPALIQRCVDLLNPGGVLYFSCNLRTFKLEPSVDANYSVENISEQTLDLDFQKNKKIHYCWKIQVK